MYDRTTKKIHISFSFSSFIAWQTVPGGHRRRMVKKMRRRMRKRRRRRTRKMETWIVL